MFGSWSSLQISDQVHEFHYEIKVSLEAGIRFPTKCSEINESVNKHNAISILYIPHGVYLTIHLTIFFPQ